MLVFDRVASRKTSARVFLSRSVNVSESFEDDHLAPEVEGDDEVRGLA